MKKILFLGISLSLILSACSIQKRVHNSGFHVTWKNREHSADKNEFLSKSTIGSENSVKSSSEDKLDLANSAEIENEPFVIINSPNSDESFSFTSTEKEINSKKIFSTENSKSFSSKNEIKTFSKVAAIKRGVKKVNGGGSSNIDINLLFILCFIIPVIAVGLATNWDLNRVLICFLLSLLCWIPGIVYALITVKEG
jgi:uncharacterized membrane protein YqaE (UPF0057 family)